PIGDALWSTSRFDRAPAKFLPKLADCWHLGSADDHPRFLPTVAEPDVGLHAASFQKAHGLHESKKGCQFPCHSEQFARSAATVDSPGPTSNAIWHALSRHRPANGAGASAGK